MALTLLRACRLDTMSSTGAISEGHQMRLEWTQPGGAMISQAIHRLENVFLLIIALFTTVAIGQEIYTVIVGRSVELKDLLLMFIYVEVLAMVGVYFDSKKIPITFPLYIAITALARLVILQGKDQPPVNLLVESGAILILALACVVIGHVARKEAQSDDRPPVPSETAKRASEAQ